MSGDGSDAMTTATPSQCGTMSSRVRVFALCVLPIVASGALAGWWNVTGRIDRPQGDEPHYLIMSASVLRDGDLDLRNNYERDAKTNEIYGRAEPHAFLTPEEWWPYHTPGLGILLALPFALGGTLAARLSLCVFAGLLGWASRRWLAGKVSVGAATMLTAAVVFSAPVMFGASQIYPDLAGGVLVLALASWVWSGSSARSWLQWGVFWLGSGLLCWLHAKYLAPAAVLALCGAWRIWQTRAEEGQGLARHLPAAALFLVGPASLGVFYQRTLGSVLGGRTAAELASPPLRALEIFLGLHLDQAQGMFFQQPLFWSGLVALAFMVRQRHPLTVPWLVLYAALILPNAFQLARYGGGGPAGRFGWSAMWLWIVPLGIWIDAERSRVERYVRPVALGCLAYQLVLALRWLPTPAVLSPVLSELVWERNSLFPVAMRYSLPSFYFWDFASYLSYLPNLIWCLAAALLVVTGLLWRSDVSRRRLRAAWASGLVGAALLLPVEPSSDRESATDRLRERALLASALSAVPRRFEAERMTPMSVQGTARVDPAASGGQARASKPARSDDFIIFGPYVSLDPGRYRVEVALRLSAPSDAERVARFEVTVSRGSRRDRRFRHSGVEAARRRDLLDRGPDLRDRRRARERRVSSHRESRRRLPRRLRRAHTGLAAAGRTGTRGDPPAAAASAPRRSRRVVTLVHSPSSRAAANVQITMRVSWLIAGSCQPVARGPSSAPAVSATGRRNSNAS